MLRGTQPCGENWSRVMSQAGIVTATGVSRRRSIIYDAIILDVHDAGSSWRNALASTLHDCLGSNHAWYMSPPKVIRPRREPLKLCLSDRTSPSELRVATRANFGDCVFRLLLLLL
ncbi:hypothetical protein CCMA1212_005870 [Trichoderma ghanense]|uniref:Uncharacterized protein n=1 Tax=Trichoderma ghanense TaxID=65468 RepID=A0ABY2H3H2_9HYPO